MEVRKGVFQRALIVAVPLVLVVLIIVTPTLLGGRSPQATDIPFFLAQVTHQPWNGTVNATALFYVRSALGNPLYDYLAINVSRVGGVGNVTMECGGAFMPGGANATCDERFIPSLWAKLPALHSGKVNVSALGERAGGRFWYNATIEFVWGTPTWILRVQPEDATSTQDYRELLTASMRLEARP